MVCEGAVPRLRRDGKGDAMFWLTRDAEGTPGEVTLWEAKRENFHLPNNGIWTSGSFGRLLAYWLTKPEGLPPIEYGECRQVWLTDKEPEMDDPDAH